MKPTEEITEPSGTDTNPVKVISEADLATMLSKEQEAAMEYNLTAARS